MPRSMLVREVMTTDVVSFKPDDPIETAARTLTERNVGGGPVVDGSGQVVGLLEDDDLIVADARLHAPTVITVLGAYIEMPGSKHEREEELRKAVGRTVAEVMDADPAVVQEDDTLEHVATLMHDRGIARLPVVRDGQLVGIVSRGDLVRTLVRDESS